MYLNSDTNSLKVRNNININQIDRNRSMEKLSSGQRINKSSDDVSGVAITSRLEAQKDGWVVGQRNLNDAVSIIQVADSALETFSEILIKMRELALLSKNDSLSNDERKMLDKEYQSIFNFYRNSIEYKTKFNDKSLLNWQAKPINIQYGPNIDEKITIDFENIFNYIVTPLYIEQKNLSLPVFRLFTSAAINRIDQALEKINTKRAYLGATLNKIDYINQNIENKKVNLDKIKSNIQDTDYSNEVSNLARTNILQESGIAVLAQVRQEKDIIIKLMKESNNNFMV